MKTASLIALTLIVGAMAATTSSHAAQATTTTTTTTTAAATTTAAPVTGAQRLPSDTVSSATQNAIDQARRANTATRSNATPPAVTGVVIFTSVSSAISQQAKQYLAGKGVSYLEVNVDRPDGAAAYAKAGGRSSVPMVIVNGRQATGFTTTAYDAMLTGK